MVFAVRERGARGMGGHGWCRAEKRGRRRAYMLGRVVVDGMGLGRWMCADMDGLLWVESGWRMCRDCV